VCTFGWILHFLYGLFWLVVPVVFVSVLRLGEYSAFFRRCSFHLHFHRFDQHLVLAI
jgi:hypothetical protein